MELEKRPDGYWITRVLDGPDCGPYDRKADAATDRRGMERFFRHADERDFFTVDRKPSREVASQVTAEAPAGCVDIVECAN